MSSATTTTATTVIITLENLSLVLQKTLATKEIPIEQQQIISVVINSIPQTVLISTNNTKTINLTEMFNTITFATLNKNLHHAIKNSTDNNIITPATITTLIWPILVSYQKIFNDIQKLCVKGMNDKQYAEQQLKLLAEIPRENELARLEYGLIGGACEIVIQLIRKWIDVEIMVQFGCSAIKNLARSKENCLILTNACACECIIECLEKWKPKLIPEITVEACHGLYNLLLGGNMTQNQGHSILHQDVEIIQIWRVSHCANVMQAGFWLATNLVNADNTNCLRLGELGICKEIIQYLKQEIGMNNTQSICDALICMVSLTNRCEQNNKRFHQLGACELVVSCFSTYATRKDFNLTLRGCDMIHVFAQYAPNRTTLVNHGAMEQVIHCFKTWISTNAEISQAACICVANLSKDHPRNMLTFCNSGTCELLVEFMQRWCKNNSNNVVDAESRIRAVFNAIANLAAGSSSIIKKLGSVGVCEEIVYILRKWDKTNEEIALRGCLVLQNLANDDEIKLKLCNAGACKQILDYLTVWGKIHQGIAYCGCGAVSNLADYENTRKCLLRLNVIEILETSVMDNIEPKEHALRILVRNEDI
jgi:hypothetical protein